MKSFGQVVCGLVVLGLGLGEARAQMQDFPVLQPPGLSPYLNLFRPGSNPALNYFDLVRPQLQSQANIQALQQQQGLLQQQFRQQFTPTPSGQGTAKVPGYMTHGKYFGTSGVIAAGTGQTHRSLSTRQTTTTNNGLTPNRNAATGTGVPGFGGASTNVAGTAAQTRTVFGPNNFNNANQFNNPGLSPTYLAPYGTGFTPFNPYRGY